MTPYSPYQPAFTPLPQPSSAYTSRTPRRGGEEMSLRELMKKLGIKPGKEFGEPRSGNPRGKSRDPLPPPTAFEPVVPPETLGQFERFSPSGNLVRAPSDESLSLGADMPLGPQVAPWRLSPPDDPGDSGGGVSEQAKTPSPFAPPTKVKTVPIAGGAFSDPAIEGGTGSISQDEIGYAPSPVSDPGLVDLYRQRAEALGSEEPESRRDKLARMLINFGSGAFAGSSNIRGRSIGPDMFESLGAAGTALGQGELEHHTGERSRKEKREDKSFDAMRDLLKLQMEMANQEENRRYKAAELALRKSNAAASGIRPPYQILGSIMDGLAEDYMAEGMPEGQAKQQAWRDLVQANPALRGIIDPGL